MSQVRIAIIVGSTREGRFADGPTKWIHGLALAYPGVETEIVDLRDHVLPLFDEPGSPMYAPSTRPEVVRFSDKIRQFDGFIIVTPEYNHGPTAVLKNAIDHLYKEFNRKAVAFVGYGGVGAARAIEQLRLVAIELHLVSTRTAVHICFADYMSLLKEEKTFADLPHLSTAAKSMLGELVWWSKALKAAREQPA